MKVKKSYATALGLQLLLLTAYGLQASADDVMRQTAGPDTAKICLNCHKAETNMLMGVWGNVARKSSTIQLSIDDRTEIITFDKVKLQLLNTAEKGDVEKMLRSIKKGDNVRILFVERDGVRQATMIKVKPTVKAAAAERITLAELEKLVALGLEKGKYRLFDSRPTLGFQEGAIPTAVSLPFFEFDKNTGMLPSNKNSLIIFYCRSANCYMGLDSQHRAKALGYKNVKLFIEGMEGWLAKNNGMLSARSLMDGYKDIPFVLIDARLSEVAAKGFIKGAVTLTSIDEMTLKSLPKKELNPPVVVYDENGRGNALTVAKAITKAGYSNVMVLADGLAGWKAVQLPLSSGKPATAITYAPRPKPGEFPVETFINLVEAIPADTIVLDVRNREEVKEDMIKGAVNIPTQEIFQRFAEIPRDKTVIAYCNTGARAEMAYHILKAKGFSNIFFLKAHVDFDNGKADIYN